MSPSKGDDGPETTDASVRFDEASDAYELGSEIDGSWVTFATVPGPQVRDRVATVKANAEAAGDEAES